MKKDVLVIGANSEIAQRTIEEMKNDRFNIYATSRHKAELPDKKVTFFHLDVEVELDFIRLKEYINNLKFDTIIYFPGIAIAGGVVELEELKIKKQLEVNFFGLLRTIKHLTPYLKDKGKLIYVSSMATYGVFPFLSPYCISKASSDILLNSFTLETGIKTVSLRLGAIATKFWENSIKINDEQLKSENYKKEKEFLIKNAQKNSLHAKNPIATAKKIAEIIELNNPKPVYNIGFDAKMTKLTRFLPCNLINFLIRFILKKRIEKS